ncbi:MAG: DUF2851 family protein [Saprospiraceae bacterium]|nr:DUF2851 family protein [Saprospiraceae bacterium]
MTIKEDLLHYVWRTKQFDLQALTTTDGQSLQVLRFLGSIILMLVQIF